VTSIESEGGLVLGISPEVIYGVSEERWKSGDRLLLFTDGVNEQDGADGDDRLGVSKIIDALAGAESADLAVERVSGLLRDHAGGDVFADDVTILGVSL